MWWYVRNPGGGIMITLAIIIWIALILLCTSSLGAGFGAYVIMFVFFCLFQLANNSTNKAFNRAKILFLLLGAVTQPVVLFLKIYFNN